MSLYIPKKKSNFAGCLYLTEKMITINELKSIIYGGAELFVSDDDMQRVAACYTFLDTFRSDKIIYGINTGFGPMAQWRVDDRYLKALQYNIIRSHATGAGEPLCDSFVLAAMCARLGSFLQAKSGVHPDEVTLLVGMINHRIIPFVPRHGSVGASGDLVQLAHIALTMIGEGKVHYKGEWRPSAEVLAECGLHPLEIHIREGLSTVNGTSVMTGISVVNQLHAENLLRLSIITGVWINEIAGSYDDSIAAPLQECRRHPGQIRVAAAMREFSADSKCLRKREHCLYNGGHTEEVFEDKVQAYYSLRCLPQILGPIAETLDNARRVIEEELNAASDNPIIDPESKNVYHGGNFHGDYISLEEDKVKIALVRLTEMAERQLNYLLHDRINGILPPFLNMCTLGLNYGMQACQFTATSTTAESQTLAMPNYVHTIPNNHDNQDIVSMGTNTALLTAQVIENAYQVTAIHMMALAQATDCLNLRESLCRKTAEIYDTIRQLTPTVKEDTPFYEDIVKVVDALKEIRDKR